MKRWMIAATFGAVIGACLAGCSEKKEESKDGADAGSGVQAPKGLQPVQTDAMDAEHVRTAQKLINDGIAFLLTKRDEKNGWSIGPGARPGATAMVLKVLVQHPDFDVNSLPVKKAFEVLLSYQRADGGIYEPKEGQQNYTTAMALMAISAANDPRLNEAKRRAIAYLKGLVIVPGSESADGQAITDDHPMRGGVSYGRHGRPDLSNVGFWAEAMHEAGVSPDDSAVQEVLAFVTRTQNFTERNKSEWAVAGENDGGFVYASATRDNLKMGESKAGVIPGGRGLRSYGSMTYTGFKSMLYANVDRDDARVQAAFEWIRRYWRLDSNPNMPAEQSLEGLYYYYHVFAKALRVWGQPVIKDFDGEEHNWRHELIDALAERVDSDGAWRNTGRWYEDDKVLCTCYAVLALQEAMKK